MCTVLLPMGVNPIAVKYIISSYHTIYHIVSYTVSFHISYHIISYYIIYIIYHIISYHIISYHIISYHIISCHISYISYHIIYHIISYIISYHIISYHIISYIISYLISYHITSYRIISYCISYRIISYILYIILTLASVDTYVRHCTNANSAHSYIENVGYFQQSLSRDWSRCPTSYTQFPKAFHHILRNDFQKASGHSVWEAITVTGPHFRKCVFQFRVYISVKWPLQVKWGQLDFYQSSEA
jgi:hypothetical protein